MVNKELSSQKTLPYIFKVSKLTSDRKHIEIPAKHRDDFELDEHVEIVKINNERKCPHCDGDINIRNPKGFCDHLYYPESCEICKQLKCNK